ncbi:hypothetical protein PG988_015686 [Apiospora saccharicola]
MDVHLLVYDLSNGLARSMSMALLGFQLDAVYHTSIELDGTEWVYDGGINTIRPGTSHLGKALQRIHLGKTQLPMEAYDLFKHNCNNFSNDFATFLVGKGIPEHISNMPQAVLESPFGKMMLPQLEQMVNAKKAQQGGLLGIQTDPRAGPSGTAASSAPRPVVETNGGHHTGHAMGTVRDVSTARQLDALLENAKKTCAIIFFTSATCPPCKTLYPLYDQLAAEHGDKATLIKVDTSLAFDIGQQYNISATPTFISFLKGEQQERWMGADASRLRSTLGLLVQMAVPSHSHQMLNLHRFANPDVHPVLYEKVPPLDKLLTKMNSDDPAVLGLKHFIEARKADGPAEATVSDLHGFANYLDKALKELPVEVMFAVVDLFRIALADQRISGFFAEESGYKSIVSILDYVNKQEACPYALRLVTLQMACNLFSSPLFVDQILTKASLRNPITQLVSTSFLDEKHTPVRVAAASLLFNLASTNNLRRRQTLEDVLPEADQVELAASMLEAISQEEESAEALRGMLLALGYLGYCMPLEGELIDLLRTMDAQGTVSSKADKFPKEKDLITEVGSELLGNGLKRK